MRELELDGIHDDGEHAVLLDSDGERYTLRIDEALRAAVRRDRPALGMIQAADSAPLRPREIQAMLRSGRSAEEIAEVSQVSIERVRRYEGPVLAEREWTAQRARTFAVGRGGPSLTAVVAERLAARQATDDVAWDAWRRPDGTWTLELTFSAAGRTRQAHWVADLDNRSITAVDDEARWISDEDAPPEPRGGRTRLQAVKSVKSSVYDLEADGDFADPADRPRRGAGRAASERQHPSALDEGELDALNARRGLRPVPPLEDEGPGVWSTLEDEAQGVLAPPADPPDDAHAAMADQDPDGQDSTDAEATDTDAADPDAADLEAQRDHDAALPADEAEEDDPADGTGAQDAEEPGTSDPADERAGAEARQGSPVGAPSPALGTQDTVDLTPLPGFGDPEPAATDDDETSGSEQGAAKRPARARSKRASMPSWDEIVFGSKHD